MAAARWLVLMICGRHVLVSMPTKERNGGLGFRQDFYQSKAFVFSNRSATQFRLVSGGLVAEHFEGVAMMQTERGKKK